MKPVTYRPRSRPGRSAQSKASRSTRQRTVFARRRKTSRRGFRFTLRGTTQSLPGRGRRIAPLRLVAMLVTRILKFHDSEPLLADHKAALRPPRARFW